MNIYAENPEITREYKIAVYAAWLDGKKIQYNYVSGCKNWLAAPIPGWSWLSYNFRVNPSEAPKKLVPWIRETVPMPGFLLRWKLGFTPLNQANQDPTVWMVSEIGFSYVCTASVDRSYEDVFRTHEHSTDGGETWLPCATEVIA